MIHNRIAGYVFEYNFHILMGMKVDMKPFDSCKNYRCHDAECSRYLVGTYYVEWAHDRLKTHTRGQWYPPPHLPSTSHPLDLGRVCGAYDGPHCTGCRATRCVANRSAPSRRSHGLYPAAKPCADLRPDSLPWALSKPPPHPS